MSKLRMEKRSKVLNYTPVYELHTKVLLGYLEDLTLKGALLISEKPLDIDRNLTLAIEFRKNSEKPVTRITVHARVAWCKPEDHRTYYNTGLEFQAVTKLNLKLIERVMKKYQFSRELPDKGG